MAIIRVRPGEQNVQDGVYPELRGSRTGEMSVSEVHGRFYEQCYRGNLFSDGMTVTALSANTISLSATTTPILGVWNPLTSTKNLVILQAQLQIYMPASAAIAGVLVWATSNNNGSITTGKTPFNRRNFVGGGALAKGMSFTALTGLSNNLVIQFGSAMNGTAQAQGATATPFIAPPQVENFDGSLIVPPGGVLALLNTTSNTTVSVSGNLLWEEVLQ